MVETSSAVKKALLQFVKAWKELNTEETFLIYSRFNSKPHELNHGLKNRATDKSFLHRGVGLSVIK